MLPLQCQPRPARGWGDLSVEPRWPGLGWDGHPAAAPQLGTRLPAHGAGDRAQVPGATGLQMKLIKSKSSFLNEGEERLCPKRPRCLPKPTWTVVCR